MLIETYLSIRRMQETKCRKESEKYPYWLIGYDEFCAENAIRSGVIALKKFLREKNERQ